MSAPLAPAWSAWLAENALRGASVDDLAAGLVAGGLSVERARAEAQGVVSAPWLEGARRLLARSAAVEQVARLRRELDDGPLAERVALDEESLYREFWTSNRPVVLRGAARDWPAAQWELPALAERFGAVEVDVLTERVGDWWRASRAQQTQRMTFAELVALSVGPPSDRVYADGRTHLLGEPGLAPMAAELGLLPGLVGDGFPRAWVGPAGTITPLHHDQSTGWLVQLIGRKRAWLASPLEVALASTAVGLYNTVDARVAQEGELAEVRWREVVLEPGDALLIPVGWWHQVEALSPSVSVSMGGFRWPNVFRWYCPGRGR